MPAFNINCFHFKKSPCKKHAVARIVVGAGNIGKALSKTVVTAFVSVELSVVSIIYQ